MNYTERKLGDFLEDMSSSSPVPAGACAAAMSGALGASLAGMVARLTLGRWDHCEKHEQMRDLIRQSDALQKALCQNLEDDIRVYNELVAALHLPRNSESEKRLRFQESQRAWIEAVKSPLEIARRCLEVLDLCSGAAGSGVRSAVSDAGCAAFEAKCGADAALLSARFNLQFIEDMRCVSQMERECARMEAEAEERLSRAREKIRERWERPRTKA